MIDFEINEQIKIKMSFENLFKTKEGEKVLNFLVNECSKDIGTYKNDTNMYIYNEGRRNVIMLILKLANIPTNSFFGVLKENMKKIESSEDNEKEWFN